MAGKGLKAAEIRDGKVLSVQLLRGLAASMVAVLHLQLGFASYVGAGFPLGTLAPNLGALAVAVFFVISGYVMVVSSRQLFAARHGARHFLARRLIRILPPCWIATAIMAAALSFQQEPYSWRDFTLSLGFIPLPGQANGWSPGYLLWPAWSLFFELQFYALFALAMLLGRTRVRTVAIAAAALVLLAGAGLALQPGDQPAALFIRPVLLLFIPGLLLGLWREQGFALPVWLRWLCLVGAIASLPQMIMADDLMQHPAGYVWRAGLPAVLLGTALMGGPLRLPCGALVSRFGDISFAVYLLHIPMAHFWIGSFRAIAPLGPWLFLLSAIVLVMAASLAFYLWVERPLTRLLLRRIPRPEPVGA